MEKVLPRGDSNSQKKPGGPLGGLRPPFKQKFTQTSKPPAAAERIRV